MNEKHPHVARQKHLEFEHQEIWRQLPVPDRSACRELLARLLIEVEQSQRRDEDERED